MIKAFKHTDGNEKYDPENSFLSVCYNYLTGLSTMSFQTPQIVYLNTVLEIEYTKMYSVIY